MELIERETRKLQTQIELHRADPHLYAKQAEDRVSFDDSIEADRLRRYELAANRAMLRNLKAVYELRREEQKANARRSEDGQDETSADADYDDNEVAVDADQLPDRADPEVQVQTAQRDLATLTDEEWETLDLDELERLSHEYASNGPEPDLSGNPPLMTPDQVDAYTENPAIAARILAELHRAGRLSPAEHLALAGQLGLADSDCFQDDGNLADSDK